MGSRVIGQSIRGSNAGYSEEGSDDVEPPSLPQKGVPVDRTYWLADDCIIRRRGGNFGRQIKHCQDSRVYPASLAEFGVFPQGKEDLDIRDLALLAHLLTKRSSWRMVL